MAATITLLKPDVLLRRKPKMFSPPATTALYSGRLLSSDNIIPFNVNKFSKKPSAISVPHKCNIISTRIRATTFNTSYCSSSLKEEEEYKNIKPFVDDHQLNLKSLSNSSCSSNSTTVSKVFGIQKMLYRMLVSLLLYVLLGFMGMIMFQHSAFAASYGRMGGSSSSSSLSRCSSSSSSWSGYSSSSFYRYYYWSSSSYSSWWNDLCDWWTNGDYSCIKCNCDKVGRKRYKCVCKCHHTKPNTCTKCISTTSTTPCTKCDCNTQCTCICHRELQNISTPCTTCICHKELEKICTPCTTCSCNSKSNSNCTCNCHKELDKLSMPCSNCNCNEEKEGDISRRPFAKNRRRRIKCTCTCNCHTTYSTSCWCGINELSEKLLSILVSPLVWCFNIVKRRWWILLALSVSIHIIELRAIDDEEMKRENGSVLMLQVGVLDKRRELQTKLNKIAQIADTSSLNGLNFVLKEVVKALLQHYGSCHFAYLYVKYDKKDSNRCFEKVLSRELGRYDKEDETFVNVDSIKYEKEAVSKACSIDNDYAVVTILVLVSGKYSIPCLEYDMEHVKTVLQNFEWIPKSRIKSVEVQWTPQKEDEVLSEQELRRDFKLLKPVNLSGKNRALNELNELKLGGPDSELLKVQSLTSRNLNY